MLVFSRLVYIIYLKLIERSKFLTVYQEYQPPTCGPNTNDPIYKPASPGAQGIGFDLITIPPAPWQDARAFLASVERQGYLEPQRPAFKFDPEAPVFVPKQDEKMEPPKKKEPVWFVVGK